MSERQKNHRTMEVKATMVFRTQFAAWLLSFECPLLADHHVKTEQQKQAFVSQHPFALWSELVDVGMM